MSTIKNILTPLPVYHRLKNGDFMVILGLQNRGVVYVSGPSDAGKVKVQWILKIDCIGPPFGLDFDQLPAQWKVEMIQFSESDIEVHFSIFTD